MQKFTIDNENIISSSRLPKRSTMKYLRIERYEDYEFTHCISYEMAIRNKEVIKLTSLLEDLNFYFKEILQNCNSEIINNKGKSNLLSIVESISLKITFGNLSILFNHYENEYLFKILEIYNFVNIDIYTSRYNEYNLKNLVNKASVEDKIQIIMILITSIECKLEKEFYVVDEKKSITPKFIWEFIPRDTNYEPNPSVKEHIITIFSVPDYMDNYISEKGYTSYQGKYKDDDSFNINKVLPNFDQPLRMFNTMEISINPSLPLNDILSFVKKIKEDYDKNNSFKSFFELTEEELYFRTDTTKSTLDNPSSYSKKKWADMFYIYDYFQFYLSEGNKINKGKNINDKDNRENDLTTIAKELSLQLSYYHILKNKRTLDFSEPDKLDIYKSAYDKYETNFFFEIKENKEYSKYIKFKRNKDGEEKEVINFYMSADHIKTEYYPKIKKLIEGDNPEYIKFVGGRNHDLDSLIDGKNNASSKL